MCRNPTGTDPAYLIRVATTAATSESILPAIENERRLEFSFEADRWFNLVRIGSVTSVLNITDPNKFVFPIPISEIIADKYLDPNLGY